MWCMDANGSQMSQEGVQLAVNETSGFLKGGFYELAERLVAP